MNINFKVYRHCLTIRWLNSHVEIKLADWSLAKAIMFDSLETNLMNNTFIHWFVCFLYHKIYFKKNKQTKFLKRIIGKHISKTCFLFSKFWFRIFKLLHIGQIHNCKFKMEQTYIKRKWLGLYHTFVSLNSINFISSLR